MKKLWILIVAVVFISVAAALPLPGKQLTKSQKALRERVTTAGKYAATGDFDKAIGELQKALEIAPDFPLTHWMLGFAYADTGRYDDAIASLEEYIKARPDDAKAYADADAKAYGQRDSTWLLWIKTMQEWDPFRSDQRFQDLLRRMNSPE